MGNGLVCRTGLDLEENPSVAAPVLANHYPDIRRLHGGQLEDIGYATIYFFAGAGLIKIGVTTDVGVRFRSLCNSSPVKLEYLGDCPGTRASEREWHGRFKHLRRHGEWFEETPELVAAIEAAVDHFWRNSYVQRED